MSSLKEIVKVLKNDIDFNSVEITLLINEHLRNDADAKYAIFDFNTFGSVRAKMLASGQVNGRFKIKERITIPKKENTITIVSIGLKNACYAKQCETIEGENQEICLLGALEMNYI